jgi:uncharacterized protein (DUF488 family)
VGDKMPEKIKIYTLGHSTRSLDEFIELLQNFKISLAVDIRSIPRSKHNPQFNFETLPQKLEQAGIKYFHAAKLGGLRHVKKNSPNLGWKNSSFRGYADYMQSDGFKEAADELMLMAKNDQIAIFCAEALWWRCHRRLLADYLMVNGIMVCHIMSKNKCVAHELTSILKLENRKIFYP